MLNKNEFAKIKEKLELFDKERENIIFLSRIILKSSKSAIYSAHRNDFKQAKKLLEEAEQQIKKAEQLFKKDEDLRNVGAYSEALEEYAEAKCFYGYVREKKLPSLTELKVNSEEFLLGICDFTGELARMAVILATNKSFNEVKKIKETIDEIYGFFSSLDLRNSELRKKSDSIKWNLKKIEEVLYDISMKK